MSSYISMLAMVEVMIAPSKDLFTFFSLSIYKLISIIAFDDIGFGLGSMLFINLCTLYFLASLC